MISSHVLNDYELSTVSQRYVNITRHNDTGRATLVVIPGTTPARVFTNPRLQDLFQVEDRQYTNNILEKFRIHNVLPVQLYLAKLPSLKPILQEAHDLIHELFTDAEIELKLVKDAEIPDDRTLVMYIWTDLDIDEAWKRLRDIENNWYLNLPRFIREKFNIDVR